MFKIIKIQGWTAISQRVMPLDPGKPTKIRIVRMHCGPPFHCQSDYVGVRHEFRAAACGVETPPQVNQVVCPGTDRIDVVESKPTFYMFNGR